MLPNIWKNYASDDGIKSSERYKYNSHSRSLIYNHVYGPFAQYCVQKIPTSVAPNSITVLAFFCSLIPHLIILHFAGEDLSVEIPGWMALACGIGQFLYMHLDNMDGKQARRINASTPLGMMFDHGLDSVTTWIIALSFAHILRIGNSPLNLLVLVVTSIHTFYIAFWEQDYTGILELGVVSPVDEGTTLVNICMISTFFYGSKFLLGESVIKGFSWNMLIFYGGTLLAVGLWLNSVKNVYNCLHGKFHESLKKLGALCLLTLTAWIVAFYSPSDIGTRRTLSLVYCFGLTMSKVIGHFQLAHVTETEFKQWRTSLLFTMGSLIVNTLAGHFTGKVILDEDTLLNWLILLNLISYVHYMVSLSRQYSRVLKIKVFRVPPYDAQLKRVQ